MGACRLGWLIRRLASRGAVAAVRLFCIGAVGLGVLAGCASLSESECRQGDWHGVGVADGRDGKLVAELEQHREACADYGVAPDAVAYESGRTEGLRSYCQSRNGFRTGSQGASYQGVCPPLLEGAFITAFEHGRTLHGLRSEFDAVERRINEHGNALRNIEGDLHQAEHAAADEPDAERRQRLVRSVRRLAEERGRLRAQIDDLRYEYELRRRRLDAFRTQLERHPDFPIWQGKEQ